MLAKTIQFGKRENRNPVYFRGRTRTADQTAQNLAVKVFCLLMCIAAGLYCSAQSDSTSTTFDTIILKKPHSAKKATLLSAVLPGSGQIYNKKVWKAPIVWAGMGTCVYFVSQNRDFYRSHLDEAKLRQNDPNHMSTLTYEDLETYRNATDEIVSDQDLLEEIDKRKRWLDLSYFALVAVYGLQIIDANVDGHLFDYDISPDISLNLSPSVLPTRSFSAGLSLRLNF